METLTARQQFILNLLVEAHIASAQPVGSRYLAERFQVPYSAATVRHEMGMLEEMGYFDPPAYFVRTCADRYGLSLLCGSRLGPDKAQPAGFL